jgi:purine-binding chemotaxis protein CheW
MTSVPDALGPEVALVCRVGSRRCALPLHQVQETLRPLPIEPLAGTPRFVLGVSVVRGEALPVVDALDLVGGEPAGAAGRFVVVKAGSRRVALCVGAIEGVRSLAPGSLEALPPLLRDASDEAIAALGILDGALLVALRSARLVPDSVWRALDAREARP